MNELVTRALTNLGLPEYRNIREIFGTVIQERSQRTHTDWAWFHLLADRLRILSEINQQCLKYAHHVGAEEARQKCEAELLGIAAKECSRKDFEKHVGGFLVEMSAVNELAKYKFRDFRAIAGEVRRKGVLLAAHDYDAIYRGERVCIEVKSVESPVTVTDVFFTEMRKRQREIPEDYQFNVQFSYHRDTAATAEQKLQIHTYVKALAGRTPPFAEKLVFGDSSIGVVRVQRGSGRIFATHAWSLGKPDPLNKEGFLKKVFDKAAQASEQLNAQQRCARVLVIDIETPGGSLDGEYIAAAKEIIALVSNNSLQPFLLLHGVLVKE